jgi:ABC-type sugar transport system substrate-binding protein
MKIETKALVLAAAVAALALTASAEAAEKPVYAVLLKTLANPYWGAMEKGLREGADKIGVEAYVTAVENESAVEPQLNACFTMLERKPAALLAAAINDTNLLPCLKQAVDNGIPVVNLDNTMSVDTAAKAGVKFAFSIGSKNYNAGGKGADWVAGTLGKDAKGSVVILGGIVTSPGGQDRVKGFGDEIAKQAPGLTVGGTFPADWDGQKAASITNDALTRFPDLVAIFAANDTMALGAIETIYAAGKGGKVAVIGVDGNSDAVASIKAGRLNASVAQLPYLSGIQSMEKTKALLAGEKVDADNEVPTFVVTKQIFDENKDPMLAYVK